VIRGRDIARAANLCYTVRQGSVANVTFCAACETYLAPGTAFCPNCGASRPQTVLNALLWSVELGEPSANPPMIAGDLLLVATQETAPPARHSTLHALSLAHGSLIWQRSFEYALVSGLAAATSLRGR